MHILQSSQVHPTRLKWSTRSAGYALHEGWTLVPQLRSEMRASGSPDGLEAAVPRHSLQMGAGVGRWKMEGIEGKVSRDESKQSSEPKDWMEKGQKAG